MKRLAMALAISLVPGLSQTPPSLAAKAGKPKFFKFKPLEERVINAVKANADEPQVAGTHRPMDMHSLDKGKWKKLGEGDSIWRLGIESPGAAGLRVHFTGFDVGAGKLWLHAQAGQEKPEVVGPYSGKGPYQDGDFWSDVVFSSSIIIEYQSAGSAQKVPFRIPEISHLIRR